VDPTPGPEYVIVHSARYRYCVHDVRPDDDLAQVQQRADSLGRYAKVCGRREDSYKVRQLVDPGAIEAAYQAGQANVARVVEAVFPTSTDTMRAFLARHRLSDTPSVGAVSVALLADVRKAISPERSSQGVGDNPEEQRP
jgi:hypothetical protein